MVGETERYGCVACLQNSAPLKILRNQQKITKCVRWKQNNNCFVKVCHFFLLFVLPQCDPIDMLLHWPRVYFQESVCIYTYRYMYIYFYICSLSANLIDKSARILTMCLLITDDE